MSLRSINILNQNDKGTFFLQALLQQIKQVNNAKIPWILQGTNACQLKDSNGTTLLHFAAEYGNTKIAEYLINSGANVNAKTEAQITPLILAVENNREEVVNLLFKSNVEIFIPNDNGQYTLELTLNILKSMIKIGYNYDRCQSLVHKILRYGNRQIVREALPTILKLHAKTYIDDKLIQPLYYLSMNELPNILEELRNYDFEVNAKTYSGRTMLHVAAKLGNASSVKFLLDRGANVNVLDNVLYTPLMTCVISLYYCSWSVRDEIIASFLNCVEILLEHDADPQIIVRQASLWMTTEFESKKADKIINLFEPIITFLALRELRGHKIELSTRHDIEKIARFQNIFLQNKSHLEKIKDVFISKSVSLLNFFTEKEAKFSQYALNKRLVFNVNHELKSYDKSSYCYRKLHERCSKLNDLVKLRTKVASKLNEIFIEICGMSIYNVAEKIVSFVCDNDLYKMM